MTPVEGVSTNLEEWERQTDLRNISPDLVESRWHNCLLEQVLRWTAADLPRETNLPNQVSVSFDAKNVPEAKLDSAL